MGHTCSFPKLRTKLWEKKSEANIWYESDFILCQSSAHNCFMARFIKPLAVGSTFVKVIPTGITLTKSATNSQPVNYCAWCGTWYRWLHAQGASLSFFSI